MKIYLPSWKDPRYLQILILTGYSIVAREVYHFERPHITTIICLIWAIIIDSLIGKIYFKKINLPLTSIIVALASTLLIEAQSIYPYLAVVTLAIISKAFFRENSQHIYNPANFGVTVVLLLAPSYATGMPGLFNGTYKISIIFLALGLLTAFWARQLLISVSWIIGFIFLGLLRAYWLHTPVLANLSLVLSPGFLIFTFHMITDPATAPKTLQKRILFGLTIAIFDAIFRIFQIPYGIFYAYFIVSSISPIYFIKKIKSNSMSS